MAFMPLIASGFYFREVWNVRKSGLTGDEAYVLSKHGKTTEDLGPLKKEVNLIREDLSNKITKFYASNQGENHLADSDSGKIMDMLVYGKSEQKQYTGKNLLELSDNQVQNGNLKFQISQGIITFSGSTDSASFNEKIKDFIVPSDGTYTISTNSDSNNESPRILLSINGGSFESALNGATKELTAADVVSLYVRIANMGSYDGRTIKPMIEKGSKVTSYEPYTGGQPSPSPDYPQEIKSVVNPIVKVYGKNMMPYPKDNTVRTNGVTLTVKDGKYTLVGKPTENTWLNIYPQVLGSTASDMLSEKPLPTKDKKLSMINGGAGYALNFRKVSNSDKVFGVEHNDAKIADEDSNGVFLYIYNIDKTYNDTFEIMISDPADTTSMVFEPYTEQEVSLPYTLNAIPVSSGGNVTINGQQYVADYVDVERGKLVKCVEKFDLSLLDVRESNDKNILFVYSNFNKNNMYKKIYKEVIAKCSHLKVTANSAIGAKAELTKGIHVSFYGTDNNSNIDNVIYVCVPLTCGTTIQEFLEWANKNAFEILYILATPTEINLTSEEIIAFKALATYYPTTNISVNSDELDGYTVFNYPISMANGWNYVKQQLSDNRDYIYDMDTTSAEAYVNSEYAVALTELEV